MHYPRLFCLQSGRAINRAITSYFIPLVFRLRKCASIKAVVFCLLIGRLLPTMNHQRLLSKGVDSMSRVGPQYVVIITLEKGFGKVRTHQEYFL